MGFSEAHGRVGESPESHDGVGIERDLPFELPVSRIARHISMVPRPLLHALCCIDIPSAGAIIGLPRQHVGPSRSMGRRHV